MSSQGPNQSTQVSLSEAGVALIMLEDQLESLSREMRRWERREQEARIGYDECKKQWNRLILQVDTIKRSAVTQAKAIY
jgi:hypothetical protein